MSTSKTLFIMSRKQKLFKKTLFKTRVVNNILRVYNDETFEFNSDWYKEASIFAQELAYTYDVNYLKVCGIIAALSPLKNWNENKKITIQFLISGDANHTRVMSNKAKSILASLENDALNDAILKILNGDKIKSFYINLSNPMGTEAVTIDRHAISICLNRSIIKVEGQITTIQYNFLASCFKEAAEILGVRPSMVQSITWEKWRELKKLN